MEWLQRIYMAMLNPIYEKTAKLSADMRDRLFFVTMFCLYGLMLVWYSINMFGIYFSHTPRMMLEACIFFVAIVFIGDKKLEKVEWNKFTAVCWILCGAVIFLMGFAAQQNFGYWLIGPVMALGFPCFYFVLLNQKEYIKYIDMICKAVILASVIYFIFAFFADAISGEAWDWRGRYKSTTSDANRLGEICVASFVCGLYYLRRAKTSLWKILDAANIALCMCNAWLTVSRSTLLAMTCMLVLFFIIVVKDAVSIGGKKKALIMIITVVCCACVAFAGSFVMSEIHKSSVDQEKAEKIEQDINARLDTSSQDVNTYSSGRVSIWMDYASRVGVMGNPADGKTPISDQRTVVSAHNTLLEFSYRSGIIAGLLFLMIEIISGIYVLKVMFRRRNRIMEQDTFIAFAAIGFIIVSNLQVAYNPLSSIIFLVYSMAVTVMFEGKRNRIA